MTPLARPAPFGASTTVELWCDPHISERMLRHHLDPDGPMASRRHAFIDESAEWLVDHLELSPGSTLLDLGCGPGLYAQRFARRGIRVLGIDVSARSVAHARETARRESLRAEFVQGDYLEVELGTGHDAAVLIYEDYCALSPQRRVALLRRVSGALGPAGRFVFDVTGEARFATFTESVIEAENLMDGFWSSEPYTGVLETWTYPEQLLALEKYTITTAGARREFWNWMHCLSPETVAEELRSAGFDAPELYGDVAGSPYDSASTVFAVSARKSADIG